jgi:hypothetical protein
MAAVDLYWLPLGAGGHSVRLNGRAYEALCARIGRRPARQLYHSALEVHVPEGRFVIEMTPVHDRHGEQRGVVTGGPVGSRWAGRLKICRYEIRRWRDGQIGDVGEAVDSPRRLSNDEHAARCMLELAPRVPPAVWGRDELHTGDMWNSNSVISWLIAGSGIDAQSITPPSGGRAPGWQAGLVVAGRQHLRCRARELQPRPPSAHRAAAEPGRELARAAARAGLTEIRVPCGSAARSRCPPAR